VRSVTQWTAATEVTPAPSARPSHDSMNAAGWPTAVQVFGGRGYMRENVAERSFRELRVERIWEGTSEVQRSIIAAQMTKRGPAALA
jgi:hypothetical protein